MGFNGINSSVEELSEIKSETISLITLFHVIEHTKNPLICDSSSGRLGGILTDENNIYLVFQKQGFNRYGKTSSIYKINELTENNFEREYICEITPDFSDHIIATHHFNSYKNCTVFDYLKEEQINS